MENGRTYRSGDVLGDTMILLYKIKDDESISIWERDTKNNKERCIWEISGINSYVLDFKKWTTFHENTLPDMVKNKDDNSTTRISRADAFLEMI